MKKMMKIRKCIFVEALCEVKYYILASEYADGHFRPNPPFVLKDKYFDTREEAEAFLEEWKKEYGFFMGSLEILEDVTELEEKGR